MPAVNKTFPTKNVLCYPSVFNTRDTCVPITVGPDVHPLSVLPAGFKLSPVLVPLCVVEHPFPVYRSRFPVPLVVHVMRVREQKKAEWGVKKSLDARDRGGGGESEDRVGPCVQHGRCRGEARTPVSASFDFDGVLCDGRDPTPAVLGNKCLAHFLFLSLLRHQAPSPQTNTHTHTHVRTYVCGPRPTPRQATGYRSFPKPYLFCSIICVYMYVLLHLSLLSSYVSSRPRQRDSLAHHT